MANPRTPVAKAAVSGAAAKNPQRHKGRSDPQVVALGDPSSFLDEFGKLAWEGFRRELPWLAESDRAMIEIVSTIRGRALAGEDIGIKAMSLLQSCLSKLGATPSDRSKVSVADGDESDPADAYFGRPN